ncbi:MAG TPA: PEP-CTERM sorting domain-containing protein [Telluria sp.]
MTFTSHTTSGFVPRLKASLGLYDDTGTAFNTSGLPTQLTLNNFQQHDITMYYFDGQYKSQFGADLTSLKRVNDVPEPASGALLASGLALLVAARRLFSGAGRSV